MTNTNDYLLELIKKETPNEEICRILNITRKQLMKRIQTIKNEGFNINRKFNYDGTTNYFVDYNASSIGTNPLIVIENVNRNTFKALLIADTHIGNINADTNYLYLIYSYCKKNNISIVFHLGDIIQGNKENIISMEEQIKFLINDYPSSEKILTFVQLGNHDEDIVKHLGLNLNTIISNNRDDMIPLGYNPSSIKIAKNNIYLSHENKFSNPTGLRIAGHSHRYKFNSHPQIPTIILPTLSNYTTIDGYPGAVEMEIKLEDGSFVCLILKQLIINENMKLKETSTINYQFLKK